MERHFDEELKDLNRLILKMGSMVEEAIRKSVEALKKQDKNLAREVIDFDKEVDDIELEVDERCIDLLAIRQPVAKDLRFITTAIRIATDLERIADLAVDIAQRAEELSDEPLVKPLIDIPKLTLLAQDMVRNALDSFVKRDIELARSVRNRDDEADSLRDLVQKELTEIVAKDGSKAKKSIPLLLVARHLERICDHATNIAEDVVYMVEGKVIKHRPF
ncbi:MAG: phosphate signaling complex protein PhoU [Candidatus Omnitrophica bacterium]|nr:phosphate signaling complex protein PhoU [Candidatus Omnitrophota bacterium]